ALCQQIKQKYNTGIMPFSTLQPNHSALLEAIRRLIDTPQANTLLEHLVHPGQMVMLITPIDSEAPAGRLILPQVQMLREILDRHCTGIVLQPEEVPAFFCANALKPDLVITDSQVFGNVAPLIPASVPLTSFSILLAHQKGHFEKYLEGTPYIERLQNGERILILESCSHHVSCEDIGRVKIPALLQKYTGKQLQFDFVSGLDHIQRPFSDYALIIQCGGCMVTSRQLYNRLLPAIKAGIPITNYGMAIAYTQGIFERATNMFTPST
ncbi:MAG: [FeFe] hydrogenase H-cluster maturation GTPase HydF, partial [Odoribacter sp.]|nr:[FeFe] hydrogenase H-cluster maturation GTPase HydF [Odoribacter sp.]